MRTSTRTVAAAALGLVMLVPAVGSAAEAPAGRKVQEVSGPIATFNPTKAVLNVSRIGRTGGLVGPETNGVTGWFFAVDEKTWGGEFVLESVTAGPDLDVIFYADPGSLTSAPSATAEFVGTEGDGERGIVPAGSTRALIYAAGSPTQEFTYDGHAAPRIEIGGTGSPDVTVLLGGAVEFVNATDDYTSVSGTTEDGKGSFTSGTGPGSGIRVGDRAYTFTFTRKGVWTYTTPLGTGTVTVV